MPSRILTRKGILGQDIISGSSVALVKLFNFFWTIIYKAVRYGWRQYFPYCVSVYINKPSSNSLLQLLCLLVPYGPFILGLEDLQGLSPLMPSVLYFLLFSLIYILILNCFKFYIKFKLNIIYCGLEVISNEIQSFWWILKFCICIMYHLCVFIFLNSWWNLIIVFHIICLEKKSVLRCH